MRKIVVAAFVSVDGVMQAPGGPDEDPSGGFRFGGWLPPHFDDVSGAAVGEMFSTPFDLLLGRKTYDIFAAYWPFIERDPRSTKFKQGDADIANVFDRVTKYVATHRPESLTWQGSQALGADVIASLRQLKMTDGPTLLTQGSTELIQQLLRHDLVDELRVLTFPLLLGTGKRLFAGDAVEAAKMLKLTKSVVTPKGVVIASYEKLGAVETGSFVTQEPSPQELERRRDWR
jgi:dihydrofolate reductase